MKHRLIAAAVAVLTGAAAAGAFAQAKPDVLVKQRQAAMTLIGKYWGPIAGMAQGKIPYNAEVATRNAAFLQTLSRMPWDGFDASTASVQSKALPAVYSEHAKFSRAAEDMQRAIDNLAAVKGGDEAAFKAAAGAVGKTCGGCHDSFRAK